MRIYLREDKVLALILFCAMLSGGCAPELRAYFDDVYRGQIVFPPPPAEPKIEFLMSIYKITPPGRSLTDVFAGPLGSDPAYVPVLPRPTGLYVRGENLYIVDPSVPRITWIDLSSGSAKHFGLQLEPAHSTPVDIAVDSEGRSYVTDSTEARVFVYTPEGRFDRFLAPEGTFQRPTGIDIDQEHGIVYVADTLAHDIKVLDLRGNLIKVIGKRGEGPGEFNYPVHLCFKNGKLYVVDAMNFRVQVFDAEGNLIRLFGRPGDTYADLQRPKGIGVDSFGNIYIADALQDMVKVFDQEGNLLLFFGERGRKLGQFSMPQDIFVDEEDRIFISDMANMRVQVFKLIVPAIKGQSGTFTQKEVN